MHLCQRLHSAEVSKLYLPTVDFVVRERAAARPDNPYSALYHNSRDCNQPGVALRLPSAPSAAAAWPDAVLGLPSTRWPHVTSNA
jgi:hypothetical protein